MKAFSIRRWFPSGDDVCYITDYFGNKIADVTSPRTGVITLVCSVPTMKKGDNVTYIGEIGDDPATGSGESNR